MNKENIVRLKTTWGSKGGINSTHNSDYLNKMAQAFYERITWLIDENLASSDLHENEQTREIRQSLIQRNNWSKLFFGRNDILGALQRYLIDSSKTSPFVVYGESGTGKTALIAKCANDTRSWIASANPVVIVRFLGRLLINVRRNIEKAILTDKCTVSVGSCRNHVHDGFNFKGKQSVCLYLSLLVFLDKVYPLLRLF